MLKLLTYFMFAFSINLGIVAWALLQETWDKEVSLGLVTVSSVALVACVLWGALAPDKRGPL